MVVLRKNNMKISRKQLRKLIETQIKSDKAVNEIAPLALPAIIGGGTAVASTTVVGLSYFGYATLAALIGAAGWWLFKSHAEKQAIAESIERDGLTAAFVLYTAMEGMGTNDKDIARVFESIGIQKDDRGSLIEKLYDDFNRVLLIVDESTSNDLIDWLDSDGRDTEASIVRFIVNGQIN